MKYRVYGLFAVVIGVFFVAKPLVAHHEILAKFDDKKPTTIRGTVTKLDWANPHVHIFMNVGTGANVLNWAVELESPVDLARGGWTRDSVKPGDALTITLDRRVLVYRILSSGVRRGPATEARTLYEDLTPAAEQAPLASPAREPGSGRPTKKERRALDRLNGDSG